MILSPEPPPRRRRTMARAEDLARLDAVWRERRYRDEQRILGALGRIERQLDDLGHRVSDLERSVGVADIGRAPRRRVWR